MPLLRGVSDKVRVSLAASMPFPKRLGDPAEYATLAELMLANNCIQRLLDGTLDDEAAYMAKWWCTEQQGKVTDEGLQLFGGYGHRAEYPIARLYTDVRIQRIHGGNTEIMKDLIARKLGAWARRAAPRANTAVRSTKVLP